MILTGPLIEQEIYAGRIIIDPFSSEAVNPNSYNYRLGALIKSFDQKQRTFVDTEIPESGYVLAPGRMYLGHTVEVIGSTAYAMSLIGRSSIGRLGLFLQISADLGHTTSCHRWTLELVPTLPIRVYPGMVIGQVSFWRNAGLIQPSPAFYARFNDPRESLMGMAHDSYGH